MKRNEDTPIALSGMVISPLSAGQAKPNPDQPSTANLNTFKLNTNELAGTQFKYIDNEASASRISSNAINQQARINNTDASQNGDGQNQDCDNDIAYRMSYQSANTLLTTQLAKRSVGSGKTLLPQHQLAKAATHYQSSISKASKSFCKMAEQNDNDLAHDELTHRANSYVMAPSNSQTDAALLPNERLQYLNLNALNSLQAQTGTNTDDLSHSEMENLEASIVEDEDAELVSLLSDIQHTTSKRQPNNERQLMSSNIDNGNTLQGQPQIDQRLFMTSLVKHTAIALAIIVPLAAVSAYAAEPTMPVKQSTNTVATNVSASTGFMTSAKTPIRVGQVETGSMDGMANPATVDSVDLSRYAGQWYEIARLPMYFQRNCAADVTATYKPNADSDSITVVNKCMSSSGKEIVANGAAVPADATGSKLKVTFLPSWLRWAPFGKADYWVLALDNDYKTALVGTPNKKYLWLLSRSPNMDSETYQTYRKIAQNQGYNLADFTLTPQTAK